MKLIAQRLPAERAADGKLPAVERRAETRDGGLAPARAAEDDERPLRGSKQLGQPVHFRSPGPRLDGHEGPRLRRVHAVDQHVLGQGDHDGTRPSRGGDGKGARDQFGNAAGIVDLDHPFRDRTEEGAEIDLLEGFAVLYPARHLADEQDHRYRILCRNVDAGRGIGRAGPAGDEADAGLSGQPAMTVGHHRRAAFLAAHDGIDAGIVQRIEHGEVGFARHAIEPVDAVRFQRVDDKLSAGSHFRLLLSSARISSVCSPSRGEGRS